MSRPSAKLRRERCCAVLMACLFGLAATGFSAQPKATSDHTKAQNTKDAAEKPTKPEKTAYDYSLPGADGKDVPLSSFKGRYLLIVNLARDSSYNDQLAALEKTSAAFQDKGLTVIGVPSNDFGAEEPGTNAEIQKAYADAKVNFPVMAVSKISGDDSLPFYQYLSKAKGVPSSGPVHWNYTKFVLDKNGKVIARLSPDVAPDSSEMQATLTEIVDGSYKPKKPHPEGTSAQDDDEDED